MPATAIDSTSAPASAPTPTPPPTPTLPPTPTPPPTRRPLPNFPGVASGTARAASRSPSPPEAADGAPAGATSTHGATPPTLRRGRCRCRCRCRRLNLLLRLAPAPTPAPTSPAPTPKAAAAPACTPAPTSSRPPPRSCTPSGPLPALLSPLLSHSPSSAASRSANAASNGNTSEDCIRRSCVFFPLLFDGSGGAYTSTHRTPLHAPKATPQPAENHSENTR